MKDRKNSSLPEEEFDIEEFISRYKSLPEINLEIDQKRRLAHPTHPLTGELGDFVDCECKYPVYKTDSGDEFLIRRGQAIPIKRYKE